jgi:SAM-dependent methyltransferase
MMPSVPLRGSALLEWLASLPPDARDAALEAHLGVAFPAPLPAPPGDHLIGYHASGVAAIVRALIEVPVAPGDVVVDLGAGLGKVVLLARLLTGAIARGIEIQPALVERARGAASRLGVDVGFTHADVREADLDDGTVFFMYAPFVGPVLTEVLDRLRGLAARRGIVVCALGVDLDREAPWLVRRPIDAFWLAIYDSALPGAAPRPWRERSPALGPCADAVALDRRPELCPKGNAIRPPSRASRAGRSR